MRRGGAPGLLVTALCWLTVVFDGYDLVVYGTVLPELIADPAWRLGPGEAGTVGSLAFAGMFFGAIGAGAVADRIGRRRTVLACLVWFSAFTTVCAAADGPVLLGALRFAAGIGIGGLLPSATALAAEFLPRRYRPLGTTLMLSGVPIGGSAAAVLGIGLIPEFGWPSMFVVAATGIVVVLPLAAFLLPESPGYLRARGEHAEADRLEQRYRLAGEPDTPELPDPAGGAKAGGVRSLLAAPYRRASVLYPLATVVTLFSWYGLGTWLPKLMREAGFDLGSSLTFLLALNLGAAVGALVTAFAAARHGPVGVAAAAGAVAGVSIATLALGPPDAATYGLLVLAGIGTHGTQCLVVAAMADYYPRRLRGLGIGWGLGAGRAGAVLAPQVGGWLLAAGLGLTSNFLAFAIASALGAAVLAVAPRPARSRPAPGTALIEERGAT